MLSPSGNDDAVTKDISAQVESMRSSAEETGHSAEEVSTAVRGMLALSQRLRGDLDRFLKTLLAA
jgi:methyl-accepting chemotaxis protein